MANRRAEGTSLAAGGLMADEPARPFRFLSDEEFIRLSARDRAIYLSLAAQELELRQIKLREQVSLVTKLLKPDE